MNKLVMFVCVSLVFVGCNSRKTVKLFYNSGELKELYVYENRADTTNYSYTRFYENGNKKSKISIVDGVPEGVYLTYFESGQKKTRTIYREGQIEGIVSVFSTNGDKVRESYYVDNKQMLFSEFYRTTDSLLMKQMYHLVDNGYAYPIGEIVRKDGVIVPELSYYAFISGTDSSYSALCDLHFEIFVRNKNALFEIIIGRPSGNLIIEEPDTIIRTTESSVELNGFTLNEGINNIFSNINVYTDTDTITFFAYKEVFYCLQRMNQQCSSDMAPIPAAR